MLLRNGPAKSIEFVASTTKAIPMGALALYYVYVSLLQLAALAGRSCQFNFLVDTRPPDITPDNGFNLHDHHMSPIKFFED